MVTEITGMGCINYSTTSGVVGVAKDHGATHPGHDLGIDHVVDEHVHLCLVLSGRLQCKVLTRRWGNDPLWGNGLFKTAAELEVKWCCTCLEHVAFNSKFLIVFARQLPEGEWIATTDSVI